MNTNQPKQKHTVETMCLKLNIEFHRIYGVQTIRYRIAGRVFTSLIPSFADMPLGDKELTIDSVIDVTAPKPSISLLNASCLS